VKPRPVRGALAATLAAVGLACAWFVAGYPTVIYDSWGYYYLAGILRTAGLRGWPTDTRTYGYALFEALVTGWRDLPPEEFRLVVFFAQLVVWLVVSALVARRLAAVFRSPGVGTAAYALAALNPVPLLSTTEPLSDLLSAALILGAVALAWRSADEGPGGPPLTQPFLSFLAAGLATMVRPANLAVVVALGVVWVIRGAAFRGLGPRHAGAALGGLVPPFLPQVAINHHLFGTFNPLIQKNLYSLQAGWGMGALKYGTLVMADHSPFLIYVNPLYRGDPSPAAFFARHPAGYAATLFLHGFGLLDRDLPFTYVTDLDPWYRWPLAGANLFVLYFAFAGAALGLARLAMRRRWDEPAFVVVATALVGAASLALYLPVEVESRFGLAFQALSVPLIVAGLAAVAGPGRRRSRARILLAAGAPLTIGAAVLLSLWLTAQRTNPFIASPANAYVVGPGESRRPPRP
jgi:hypothetical protein